MTAEKKKVYGNMRIMAIQGKDLFRTESVTALKNGTEQEGYSFCREMRGNPRTALHPRLRY